MRREDTRSEWAHTETEGESADTRFALPLRELCEMAVRIGAHRAVPLETKHISVSHAMRLHCLRTLNGRSYRCPKWNKGLMCPTRESMPKGFTPETGALSLDSTEPFSPERLSVSQFAEAVRQYEWSILIQIDLRIPEELQRLSPGENFTDLYHTNDPFRQFVMENLWKNEIHLHEILLSVEERGRGMGYGKIRGLASGPCRLCEGRLGRKCVNRSGEPCPFPSSARSSMEAMGVNVVETCEAAGMPIGFPIRESITWCALALV